MRSKIWVSGRPHIVLFVGGQPHVNLTQGVCRAHDETVAHWKNENSKMGVVWLGLDVRFFTLSLLSFFLQKSDGSDDSLFA